MWWNLPPEELDEVIEANEGKLNPFMHIEEDEKKFKKASSGRRKAPGQS